MKDGRSGDILHFVAVCWGLHYDQDEERKASFIEGAKSELLFSSFDLDADNFLTLEELKFLTDSAFTSGGTAGPTFAQVREEMRTMDIDHDGKVSRDEMALWLKCTTNQPWKEAIEKYVSTNLMMQLPHPSVFGEDVLAFCIPTDLDPGGTPQRASEAEFDDGEPLSPTMGDPTTFTDDIPDTAFSLDDLMDAVQVAGKVSFKCSYSPRCIRSLTCACHCHFSHLGPIYKVPEMEGIDPRTSLEALGVPLRSADEENVSEDALLAVERRPSTKLDTISNKVGEVERRVSGHDERTCSTLGPPITYITEAVYSQSDKGFVKEQPFQNQSAKMFKMFRPSLSAAEISVDQALDGYIHRAATPASPQNVETAAARAVRSDASAPTPSPPVGGNIDSNTTSDVRIATQGADDDAVTIGTATAVSRNADQAKAKAKAKTN
jgi:hypothetical protein